MLSFTKCSVPDWILVMPSPDRKMESTKSIYSKSLCFILSTEPFKISREENVFIRF